MKINLIVAGCRLNGNASDFGIGQEGQLPWRLKQELKHFATLTKYTKDEKKQNAVLMGRKTWELILPQTLASNSDELVAMIPILKTKTSNRTNSNT